MRRVLFLCTGNSCRSQMAEAIVNAKLPDRWLAFSAGTKPAGYLHPMASQALSEIGIEHHGRSKHVNQFKDAEFDLVVTVCDSAAEECPAWLRPGRLVHIGFTDPAIATGTDDQVMKVFRQVRDDIIDQILPLLNNIPEPQSNLHLKNPE